MRKNLLLVVFVLALMLNSIEVFAKAYVLPTEPGIFIYIVQSIEVSTNQVKIKGYFRNKADIHDVYNINSFKLSVFDNNKKKIVDFSVTDGGNLSKIVIPQFSKLNYDFTVTNVNLDKSKFDMKNLMTELSCNITYEECNDFKGCSICKSYRSKASAMTTDEAYGSGVPEFIDCANCENGFTNEKCKMCDGKGKSGTPTKFLPDGTMIMGFTIPCVSCRTTGRAKCFTCVGSGQVHNPEHQYTMEELRIKQAQLEATRSMLLDMQARQITNNELQREYEEQQQLLHEIEMERMRQKGDSYKAPDFGTR